MNDTTTFDERGNRIVTNYEPKPRTEYEGTARGDSRKKGESRVEQNLRLRDESRAVGSTRPDSRESVNKEKARKKAAHAKIDEDTEKVRSRQRWEKEPEEEEEEPQPKSRKQPKRKEPSTIQNIGRNVGGYVAQNSGVPSWLGRGGGMPPAMRMGPGSLPPAYSMGMGKPPAWLFGGMPGAPAPVKGKKKSHPAASNGLPSWFRY